MAGLGLTAAPALANLKGDFSASGVYIRQGPSTGYPANGLGYPGQQQCTDTIVSGQPINGNYAWGHLRDIRTGVTGYSSEVYLYYYYPYQGC